MPRPLLLAVLAGLLLGAPPAAATPGGLGERATWELAVHTALLEGLDAPLRCPEARPLRPIPPWLHLFIDVAPDGARVALTVDGLATPRWLVRCLGETLPSSLPGHGDETPRRVVRTLFFDDGLAEDGFQGPQRLRLPLLIEGRDIIGQAQTSAGSRGSSGTPRRRRTPPHGGSTRRRSC